MRSIAMPSLSHQTESFERLNKALGLAKGTPLSERMASGKPSVEDSVMAEKVDEPNPDDIDKEQINTTLVRAPRFTRCASFFEKRGGVCRCHLLCCAERGRQTPEQMGSSIAVCCVDQAVQ
jgi:hypothetical protein